MFIARPLFVYIVDSYFIFLRNLLFRLSTFFWGGITAGTINVCFSLSGVPSSFSMSSDNNVLRLWFNGRVVLVGSVGNSRKSTYLKERGGKWIICVFLLQAK